ncbi:MAG TPA: HmuY family protein [Saprospiraceae bacterium]|nr:HmuY family protein [Flavobacteriales bacterium]HRJ40200.1 HmuY family protein [Flavobacteriales bacterium]HRQ31356.1 HmuY family protein [Saprospiraceae bacterium]
MKPRVLFFILVTLVSLPSCLKEELPVESPVPGDIITQSISMGTDYRWQIYFDLGTNSVVGQNLKCTWDLAFQCDGDKVFLNSAKFMFIRNTQQQDFSAVTDTSGFHQNRSWDEPSGHPDSTAIGNWFDNTPVYIIDRGYDHLGNHLGFRKIRILNVSPASYVIRFAHLDGSGDTTITLQKDPQFNFTFFTFDNGGTPVQVEPPKDTWDLVFTQYTHIFYDETPVAPYLVVGCLINNWETTAAFEPFLDFSEIDYSDLSALTLTNARNRIGYDWKVFEDNTFTTLPEFNYIIRDAEGFYFKLHFIDFYNNNGEKGHPQFEFQQL